MNEGGDRPAIHALSELPGQHGIVGSPGRREDGLAVYWQMSGQYVHIKKH